MAPQVGFEPTTLRLTAECSTVELLRSEGTGNFITPNPPPLCQIQVRTVRQQRLGLGYGSLAPLADWSTRPIAAQHCVHLYILVAYSRVSPPKLLE